MRWLYAVREFLPIKPGVNRMSAYPCYSLKICYCYCHDAVNLQSYNETSK